MQWKQGDINGACELLNEAIHKRLAKKLLAESKQREYISGKLYACQDLYRDAYVKGLLCSVSIITKEKKGLITPEYIMLGDIIFKCVKIDSHRQHCWYELSE